ncbi:MAG: class I SAM-dependent methyltransferase [Candidatus Omnitrophota bacterium]
MFKAIHFLNSKIIKVVIVCLLMGNTFFITNVALAVSIRNTLAVESRFAALINKGILPDFQTKFEILAGARLLLAGKNYSAVNGMIIEKHGYGIERGVSRVEFLPGVEKSGDGKKVKARFIVNGREDIVFNIECSDTKTNTEINEVIGGGKGFENIFQQNDTIKIINDSEIPIIADYRKDPGSIWVPALDESNFEVIENCGICGAEKYDFIGRILIRGKDEKEITCFLAKCSHCGLRWLYSRPKIQEVSKVYNAQGYYGGRCSLAGTHIFSKDTEMKAIECRVKDALEHFKRGKKGRLLEIGFGEGNFLDAMKKEQWEVEGIDVSWDAVQALRAKDPQGVYYQGDCDEVKLSGEYDLIACFDLIEHMPSPKKTLEKIHSLLKEDGIVIIRIPFFDKDEDPKMDLLQHNYHFAGNSFVKLLNATGFKPKKIFPSGGGENQYGKYRNVTYVARKTTEVDLRKVLSKGCNNEVLLLAQSSRHLKINPVNMYIDLEAIPSIKKQLEENMETLARAITWQSNLGLNIRYILENDDNGQAQKILKDKLGKILASRVGGPYIIGEESERQNGERIIVKKDELIDVRLENMEEIAKDRVIDDREYVVALKDDISETGVIIPNYIAAMAMGLSLAALRVERDKIEEQQDTQKEYELFRGKILDKFRHIYKQYDIIEDEDDFSVDELELMVMGSSATKLYYTVLYALPPALKAIKAIHKFHQMIRDILIAA